jgi:hypothetical protein
MIEDRAVLQTIFFPEETVLTDGSTRSFFNGSLIPGIGSRSDPKTGSGSLSG